MRTRSEWTGQDAILRRGERTRANWGCSIPAAVTRKTGTPRNPSNSFSESAVDQAAEYLLDLARGQSRCGPSSAHGVGSARSRGEPTARAPHRKTGRDFLVLCSHHDPKRVIRVAECDPSQRVKTNDQLSNSLTCDPELFGNHAAGHRSIQQIEQTLTARSRLPCSSWSIWPGLKAAGRAAARCRPPVSGSPPVRPVRVVSGYAKRGCCLLDVEFCLNCESWGGAFPMSQRDKARGLQTSPQGETWGFARHADRPIDSVDRSMPLSFPAGITRNGVHPQIRLRVLVLSLNVGRCGQGRRRAATSSLAPARMGLLDCGPRGGEGVAENSVPGIRPGPTLHDKHTIGRWAPGPQHEPRGGPESQSAHSSRDRPRRGRVLLFEDAAVDGRNAQILLKKVSSIPSDLGSSQCFGEGLEGFFGRLGEPVKSTLTARSRSALSTEGMRQERT